MPTPVSCFSPFTPFTPAPNAHGSGGYFDGPTTTARNTAPPFSRRPDLCSHSYSSSSSTRISRVSTPIDSSRQPAENGWRTALRMREEALSAWEHQVRSNTTINNITTLRPPRQFSGKPTQAITRAVGETSIDKSRPPSSDRAKQGSQASRPSLRLSLHIQQALRKTYSENLVEQAVLAMLPNTSRSFDNPSVSGNSSNHGANASRV